MTRSEWPRIRKQQIKFHNVRVKREIQKLQRLAQQEGRRVGGTLQILRNCLIDDDDTAPIALMKHIFFWFDLGYISDVVNATAVVPEWWQVRIEAKRPQLVIEFGKKTKKGTIGRADHTITIPHPKFLIPPRRSPIPSYQKGQKEGILTLSDNSKVIVNATSEAEAERVLKAAKKAIKPKYLQGSHVKIGTRKGVELQKVEVFAARGKYFPNGLQDMTPKWIANFK